MDFSQVALNQGLTFLVWVTGIVIIVIAGFLAKLLFDLSKLSKNLNETTTILNAELEPTLKSLNETLQTVNELVQTTDKGIDSVKGVIEKVFLKTKSVSESIFGGFLKGFAMLLNIFLKKK